jgi:hypothetical protein
MLAGFFKEYSAGRVLKNTDKEKRISRRSVSGFIANCNLLIFTFPLRGILTHSDLEVA